MTWLSDVRDWLFPPGPNGDASPDEKREAKELGRENKRHIRAIEHHVSEVSNRVRADAERADERVRGR